VSAIQGTVTKFLSLADGTLRIQVDVHHGDTSTALGLLCEVGTTVAVARLVDDKTDQERYDSVTVTGSGRQVADEDADDPAPAAVGPKRDPLTGKVMKHFYTSGFFQSPKVCRALGLDAEFLQWCRHQRCWKCDKVDMGEGGVEFVQAAHVRRINAGSGTSVKPQYSAIPLCSECHSIQHAVGESGLAPPEWWAEKAARARQEWGHQKLRYNFGVESISAEVCVESLWDWLKARDLLNFVPAKVRRDVEGKREAAPGSAGGVGAGSVVER
jgi:hypothetical protein